MNQRLRSCEPSTAEMIDILTNAAILDIRLHPAGSNFVFVVTLDVGGRTKPVLGVYKPMTGERPLRDFPPGTLYRRECASYVLGSALGWPNIPPTVIRDGPHGIGSLQLYIESDQTQNFFTMRDDELNSFAPIAAFDQLANNADRKGGACLKDHLGQIWAIDHGLTFNWRTYMRTVMFEFSGEPWPDFLVINLREISPQLGQTKALGEQLRTLLGNVEVAALQDRIEGILARPRFPVFNPQLNVPWPFV